MMGALGPAVLRRFGKRGLLKHATAKTADLVFGARTNAALSERVRRRIDQ
jgi:hypothetical protein